MSLSVNNTCGVKSDGTGWCWGYNLTGQLGNGTTTNSTLTPVQVAGTWTQIAIGGLGAQVTSPGSPATAFFACGVKSNGTGWCWGGNGNGELGDGTTTERDSPVQIAGSWKSITPSQYGFHTCGLTTANALYCWGYNGYGQLGQGNTTDSLTPVQVPGTWNSYSVGSISNCAINTSHALYCWGQNGYGVLGDGTGTERNSPVQIGSGTSWAKISTGSNYGSSNTCGMDTSGNVYCWGANIFGQDGVGSIATSVTSPTALATSAVPGTAWTDIQVGGGFTCGLRDDSTIYCWGSPVYGEIGDPEFGSKFVPVAGN